MLNECVRLNRTVNNDHCAQMIEKERKRYETTQINIHA